MINCGGCTMDKKKLYAVLWIDDYGSLKLKKKDVEWFHKNAGPISYAFEHDDQFPWSFDILQNSKKDFSYDCLAYHYHPIKWIGANIPKKIYDSLKLYLIVFSFMRAYRSIPFSKSFLRLRNIIILIFGIFGFIIFFTYQINILICAIISFFYAISACLFGVWYYVKSPKNWQYMISDFEWNKKFILNEKNEFEKRGFSFPKVVRHGWNLPWKGSIEFYMNLGIIADASALPVGIDSYQKILDREMEWRISQPYYTSLHGDYNMPWNGKDDRGLLELPVTLGNISAYGFGEKEKKMIAEVPNGGLISVYIHPPDRFEPIKDWVKYLVENYDVGFINAEDAANIYSQALNELSLLPEAYPESNKPENINR